jgi:LysR family hydrogen peroxide-inducible transcriptional activator
MISIKQLRYFNAVAQTGHFGAAAEQCSVTQPALSMQIQELEKELGLQLLERARKGVSLTPGGREMPSARPCARKSWSDRQRAICRQLLGMLHLGHPFAPTHLLPQLLPLIAPPIPISIHLRDADAKAAGRAG